MSRRITFKAEGDVSVLAPVDIASVSRKDKAVYVWDGYNEWTVHPDDAERVWREVSTDQPVDDQDQLPDDYVLMYASDWNGDGCTADCRHQPLTAGDLRELGLRVSRLRGC